MTLDFARVPNLEKLILKGCTKLSTIQASLGDLKHLILLDLSNCTCLESLPDKISWESLKTFIVSGCSKLKRFPEIVGNMSCLQHLHWDGTAIEDLPPSMKQLTGLIILNLTNCKNLSSLPRVICNLTSLQILTLSGCLKLDNMPMNWGNLEDLVELDLSGTAIEDLPSSMKQLTGLRRLYLTNCKNLSSLPRVICNLTSLNFLSLSGCLKLDNMPMNFGNLEGLVELDLSGTAIREIPSCIFCLKNLKRLSFQGCNGLLMTKNPDLMGLVLPSVSGLCSLTALNIRNCNLQAIPSDIGCLSLLEELDLSENNFDFIPESINQLSNLEKFWVENCKSLQFLPELPLISPCIDVFANGCTSLEVLLPVKNSVSFLHFFNCFQFVGNQGCGDLFTKVLREYFQESIEKERFDVVIPGSGVPDWFGHKSEGDSINLEVPSYLFKQFRGIALCAVFRPPQHHPPNDRRYYLNDEFALSCYFAANGDAFCPQPVIEFSEEIDTVESDHRWFMYLLPNFFGEEFLQIADGSSCQLEFTFTSQDPRIEIKKCGAHLVYEEEIEDLKQSMGQSKRSRDDENGGSGEGSSTHIPHPKTKRVRLSDGE